MNGFTEPILKCDGISQWFGDGAKRKYVLHNVNLKVLPGEIVSFVGPSGSGKTTLLRAILGTQLPRAGNTVIQPKGGGKSLVVDAPCRNIGIVFQRYSLYPWMTAQENVAFGLKLAKTSIPYRCFAYPVWRKLRKEHLKQAAELLEKVGLGESIKLRPSEMSGGMCQRVAIAQALIMEPEILLLDEPFGALDEAMREELQKMLLRLYAENIACAKEHKPPPYTIVIVTHELNEAIYVGDRIIAISQYWDWKEKHETFPGATIVYDKMAPIFGPDQDKTPEDFTAQRDEIRRAAFDADYCQPFETYQHFWKELEEGNEHAGIFASVPPSQIENRGVNVHV